MSAVQWVDVVMDIASGFLWFAFMFSCGVLVEEERRSSSRRDGGKR